MRTSFVGFILSIFAALATTSASAITFPSLTTIYVGGGLYSISGQGVLAIHCANASGVRVTVRVLLLYSTGTFLDSATTEVTHGETAAFSTNSHAFFEIDMDTPDFTGGLINIEATESGVFCNVRWSSRTCFHRMGSSFLWYA